MKTTGVRNLVTRLILWLCARFDVWPIDEARIPMADDAKARSMRWQEFAGEEGGLFDMIEAMRTKAFEEYSALPPAAHAERDYLALSDRNLRALKQRVVSVIAAGEIAEKNDAMRQRMNVVPARKSV